MGSCFYSLGETDNLISNQYYLSSRQWRRKKTENSWRGRNNGRTRERAKYKHFYLETIFVHILTKVKRTALIFYRVEEEYELRERERAGERKSEKM